MARYVHRDLLKDALGIDATSSGDHDQLDDAAENISRLIDRRVGFSFHPASGTRFYRPRNSTRLLLDYPLLTVDSIQTSSDGGSTYGSTLSSNDYYLLPDNATLESPRQPFWGIEIRPTATGPVFSTAARGTRITGNWGYFDERTTSTMVLSTGMDATQEFLQIASGASGLHPGQTVRLENEQIFVLRNGLSGSDTATTSGRVAVQRGQNGTSGVAHASGVAVQTYSYPAVERAALYQAQQDYRAKDAPLGDAGASPFGPQRPVMAGGLHPFTLRIIDQFRKPVVG